MSPHDASVGLEWQSRAGGRSVIAHHGVQLWYRLTLPDNTLGKATFLMLIHFDNLAPICTPGRLRLSLKYTRLLPPKPRGAQEFGADTGVLPNSKRNSVNISHGSCAYG